MKKSSIWVWLSIISLALCIVSSARAEVRTVDDAVAAWLKLWGEDVAYSVTGDRQHEACKAILALGPAAVPALVQTFRMSTNESPVDWWRRDTAAMILDQMGPAARQAVPDLILMLGASNISHRCWAAQILGSIGPDASAAVPALIRSLHDKALVRGDAAFALGKIGAEEQSVVPELTLLLQDKDAEVQRLAVVALGKFGTNATRATTPLNPFLQSPDKSIREATARALHQIEPGQSNAIQEQLKTAAETDHSQQVYLFRHDPGLYCRAIPDTNCLEQGMPLKIKLEAWSKPEELPPTVKNLPVFLIQERLCLHLTNRTTQRVLELDIEERNDYALWGDDRPQAQLLDGRKLGPWDAWFRLVRLRSALEPGTYDCSVELACPNTKPKGWWDQKGPDWQSFGFWSGRIFSPPFSLKVIEETPKTKSIVVHGKPYLDMGKDGTYRLVFKKEEFSTMEIQTRNGFYLGQTVSSPDGCSSLQSGCTEYPTNQDMVLQIPARVKWPKYQAKIFETMNPPGHFWQPYASDDSYKVLWEVKYQTNLLSDTDVLLTTPR